MFASRTHVESPENGVFCMSVSDICECDNNIGVGRRSRENQEDTSGVIVSYTKIHLFHQSVIRS